MEFSHLLAELKNASEEYGKDASQNSTETSQFCQTVCKVADNLEKHIKKYENQIIGLWVIYGYVTELYPRLERGQATSTLCQKLFNVSAQIVLDVQFGQLDEDQPYKNNFRNTLTAFHQVVSEREGSSRFSLILSLMETHWTHPVLSQVMSNDEDDEEGSGLEYIISEDPDILRLRVEMMLQQNCEEFALNLCTWCLKHPALKSDLDIRQIQLTLMDKLHDLDRLQEEAETISPKECVALVQRFMELPKNQKVCTVLTQTFLVQNWIKEGDDVETIELFKLWIKHQYMVDEDEDKFISNLWAIAKLSRTTEQIVLIIDLIREKCGDSLLQFYTDMCIYAINIDKSVLEKSMQNGEMSEIQTHQQDMSLTCCKLADIFRYNKLKTARYSIVTAFSLNPSYSSLTKVESFYKSDNPALLVDTGQHVVAKCCGNCTYNRGVCTQKNKDDKDKINPATVYEVERLLNMLRPYNLKPELSWKELGPACTKYLQERERILALMADAEAKKKAQPNQLSHQQLTASLREKLLVAAGHNKAAPVESKPPPPKPVSVPMATVEASTETKSYASNLQQVVENLQKRLGKAPVSGKVRPRTGQSINLAKNSGNVLNNYSMNSANQLPTASQILAQKKSEAESIRQRTTQQIAATIQQTFLRQHEPEKPNFMVRVHNTNPNQVPTNASIRQTFINPSNQPPQRFMSRPQEINKQYLVQLQQRQQASKVRMLKPQQVQSHHQTVQQTLKNPQQIIHSTVDSLNQFSNSNQKKIVQQKISPSGQTFSTIQVKKGQMFHGYQQVQNPVTHRTSQGIVSVGFQNTRPQLIKQTVQPSSQFQQRVQTTQIRSQNPQQLLSSASTVQSMKTSQTVVNRVMIPSQYTQGQKPPTSQEVIQQAKNQLYTLSQKKSPQPMMRVNQPAEAQRLSNTITSAQFIETGSNIYTTSQGAPQITSPNSTTVQFQQAQQLLQTQADIKPTKGRGLPISSSSAHQATLALADKSKMIKKRPVTASQNQLLAKAEAQGYASGKAVVKILQSYSPTSPGSSPMVAASKVHPGSTQQLVNVGTQQFGSRIVTLNQPQQVIQKTVIQSSSDLPSSSYQQVITNQPVYQQHLLSTQLNPVQTDLNTLLTVASANTRTNTSQSIAVMPTTMNVPVYRTIQQNVLNPTVLSVQSDLSSITPTIPQMDSQQFRQLQNQVTASQTQHPIPTPNISAQQLQEELNKINQHSQQTVSSNPNLTITVKPSHPIASSSLQKLQPDLLRPKIASQNSAYLPKVAPRPISSTVYSPTQQLINQKSSPLSSSAPQLHRMLIKQESSQVPKQVTMANQGLGDQGLSVYGNAEQRPGNIAATSSQHFVQEGVVKSELVSQEANAEDQSTPEQQAEAESVNIDKYAEEQKNIFVKSLLNASDEILETLSALPDPSLITDLFKNANPGDELHIALSDNIEDLGIDDMTSLIIPESETESTAVHLDDNNVAEHVEQTNVQEAAFVPVELDPAAQSLRDVQGIHIPEYNEQYQVNSGSSLQQSTEFTMMNQSSHQINEAYRLAENNERRTTNVTGKASTLSKKCGSVFKCIICSSVFSSLESLQYHVQRVCKPDDSLTNIHESLKLPDSKSGGINAKTIYQCVKCSSICISEKEMQLHTKNCPKDNSHLFGMKKPEHSSVLPSANKDYQSVKRLVEKQQMEIQKEKEMMKAKKEKEQQLKKIQAQKVLQKQKELKLKREAAKLAKAPPPPRFKEMTSSSGKTFYKCDLCGQTFCSPEGVHDHWLPCLKKNPITKRIRRPNPGKQKILENPEKFTKMMSTIFDSVVGPVDSNDGTSEDTGGDKDNKDAKEVTEDGKSGTTEDQESSKDEQINGESENQKIVKTEAEGDAESKEDKPEQDGNSGGKSGEDAEDAEKDKIGQDDEEEASEDAQSTISTGTDISESDRSLRKRRAIRTPRYFFSSDSDEDMKKAKKLSQMETAKNQIFPEVELARLKKNSTCCLCATKLKDMTIKLQHFAVKHLKIHTIIKSWKGHFFKCHLCNVKFNIYTKYVFHLKDHETEILMKISKMLGKDGSSKTGTARPQATDMKLSLLAARKSVKKHLSPLKKPAPVVHITRKRGRPTNKQKMVGIHKKHREDPKSDSDQRSERRNVRAAHAQALSKIKNNANGFDILNTLPHFNVDVSSSGHSRSCSPELMTTRRKTRSRRTSVIRNSIRESDEESSQPDMSEKEIDLSDKETENSQESSESHDTVVKLSDLEAEEEVNSETNESQDKDTTDQDSVYKPSTSDDSQTSEHSSNLEAKVQPLVTSFMNIIGDKTKEKEVTDEKIQTSSSCTSLLEYRADPSLHRHLYKNIGKYKGTIIPEPKKIQRGRRSVAAIDAEDSKEKPPGRSRRLSDSDLLTKHKHLLSRSELRIVLQKLPEHLIDQTPGGAESVRTSTSDDTIIERGLSEERRLDSPAVYSPTISEVSSRARSEEVEVIMMADTSPSQVISCLLGSNTAGSPPLTIVASCNVKNSQKSSEIVKLENEEDIILIEKNSDDEEEIEDADDNTADGDPLTVGGSLTTCVVVKADTPPEGVKPSSADLIIIENRSQPVDVFPNTAKNEVMAETKVEISQNNATEIHVVKGAKLSLLTDSDNISIPEEQNGSSNCQATDSNIESQCNLNDSKDTYLGSPDTKLSKPNRDAPEISEPKPDSPIPATNSSESQNHESKFPASPESLLPQPESPIPAINSLGSPECDTTQKPLDAPIPAMDSKTPTVMPTCTKKEMQDPQQLAQHETTPEIKSQSPVVDTDLEATSSNIQLESAIPVFTPNTESPIPSVDFNPKSPIVDSISKETQVGVNDTSESPIHAYNSKDQANSSITPASSEQLIPAVEPLSKLEVPAADATLEVAPLNPQSLRSESPISALSLDSKSSTVEIQSITASTSAELEPDSPIPGVFLSDVKQSSPINSAAAADDLEPASVTTEEEVKSLSSTLFEALTNDLSQSDKKLSTTQKVEMQQNPSNDLIKTEASMDTVPEPGMIDSDMEKSVKEQSECEAKSPESVPSPKEVSPEKDALLKEETLRACDDKTVTKGTELAVSTEGPSSPDAVKNNNVAEPSTSIDNKTDEQFSSGFDHMEVHEIDSSGPQNTTSEGKANVNSDLKNDAEELPETSSKDHPDLKVSSEIDAEKSHIEVKDPEVVPEGSFKEETYLKVTPDDELGVENDDAGSQPLPKYGDTSEDETRDETEDKDPDQSSPKSYNLEIDSIDKLQDANNLKTSQECVTVDSLTTEDNKVEESQVSRGDQTENDSKESLHENAKFQRIPEASSKNGDSKNEVKVSSDPQMSESGGISEITGTNVLVTDSDSTDHKSESITESNSSEADSKDALKDAKKVLKSRQAISVTDSRFVQSVAHSIKLLNSNNSAELKIVDYSESDSEIDSEVVDSRQLDLDTTAEQQPSDQVIEASTDDPVSSTEPPSKDAVTDSKSSKPVDEHEDSEDVCKEETKKIKVSETKPREAHFKTGELLTSIASKDFSSKDLPMSVADNLSKLPKIGSSVITKCGNTHKILDVKITQPEKPEEEEMPEAGKRSGLIQSLREQIIVKPFKWDEDDEDSHKNEKNDRSRQAVRNQSGNVAPFTLELSKSEQSSGGESPTKKAKVTGREENADSQKGILTAIVSKGMEKKGFEVTAVKDIIRPGNSSKPKDQNPAPKDDRQPNNPKVDTKDPKIQNSSDIQMISISKIETKDLKNIKEDIHQKAGKMDTKQLKGQKSTIKEDPVPKHTGNSSRADFKQQHNDSCSEDHSWKERAKTKSSTAEIKQKTTTGANECSDTANQSDAKSKQKPLDSSSRPTSGTTNTSSDPAQATKQSSSANSQSRSTDLVQSIKQQSATSPQTKSSDSTHSTRNSSSVNTTEKSVRGKDPSKNNSTGNNTGKCSTRSSTKPFVRTSERQRLRQLSPNKFTRYSPSKSLSPLKKSLNHLRYRDKNGKNMRKSPIRIGHKLEKSSRRNSDKNEEDRTPKSATSNDNSTKEHSNVSSSNRDGDKQTRTIKRENSDYDLHNNEKKLKSAVETSSNSSETSNSDNPSPVRRSKRRLERLHRKLCCDEDHEGDKKRKLDDNTNCRHGPSSTCSSCIGKKVDAPLPAVVRRSSTYRRHSYHHTNTQEIKKVKHSPTPPTRNVTMVRVECDSPIKDPRGHQRSLSDRDRKQSDQDNKWKFRPRNKNKKYPYTYTRAREKE